MPDPGSGQHPPHRGDGSTLGWTGRTYAGWEHSWRLQRRRIGFGFLPLSQKFLCTIRLSLFRRQPYLVYWMPGRGRAWAVRQWVRGSHRLPAQSPPASPLGRVLSDVTAQVGPKRCFTQACRRCSCGCQTPPRLLGSPSSQWGAHAERGEADSAFPRHLPPPSCSPQNPGQNVRVSWWRQTPQPHEHLAS